MKIRLLWATTLALVACGDKGADGDDGQQQIGDGGDDCANATAWYADADGDGFGDERVFVLECDQPDGYVAERNAGFDCDDTDPAINPDAVEVCDPQDVDENCDGWADDDDFTVDLTDGSTWYPDVDNDGYGSDEGATTACDDPSEGSNIYRSIGGDCDDNERGVNPGATEVCDDDDVDEDCNGLSDDLDPDVDTEDGSRWYTDADGDGYGDATDPGSIYCDEPDGDGWSASANDCNDDDIDIHPGALEYCDDVDSNCDDDTTDAGVVSLQKTTGWFDLSTDFKGSASSPATPELRADGIVHLCPGTYYVNITIDTASVVLKPRDGADTVTLSGGGKGNVIAASDSNLVAENLTIEDGSGTHGGGIDLQTCTFELTSLTIGNSLASVAGGGLAARNGSEGTLDTVTIEGNTADSSGGGIYVGGADPSTVSITGATVTGNTVVGAGGASLAGQGGGIVIDEGSIVSLDTSEVSSNTASVAGGGLAAADESELELTDVAIDGNTLKGSGTSGGGLYVSAGTVSLDTVTVSDNTAANGGGAYLKNLASECSLADVDFDSNSASTDGGGLYVHTSDVTMTDGSFTDNSAIRDGGGFFLSILSDGTFTADSVDFDGNTPSSGTLQTKSYYFGSDESFVCDWGTTSTCE